MLMGAARRTVIGMNVQSVQSVFVAVPLDAVAARMPATVHVQGMALSLNRAGATADHLRYDGSWEADGAAGTIGVDVTSVSPTASQLEVTLVEPAVHRPARSRVQRDGRVAAVATVLAAQLERRPSSQPRPRPPRRPLRVAVPVAAAVVILSVVAASALLAPSPVTLDVATARYRETVAASAATATPGPRPTASQQVRARSRDAGDVEDAQPARRPPAAGGPAVPTRTTVGRRVAAAQTPVPAGSSQRATQRTTDQRRTAAPERKVVPEPGVYRYATDGWEEVDVPRGHRRFPPETTQTVVTTDCGYRTRWDPLEERWDENSLCVRDGVPQPAELRTYRSFFGRAVEQHFLCRSAKAPRGAVWAVTCTSDDTTMTTVARSLGQRTMRVDGEDVEVSGLQVVSELEGANTGRRTALLWHARAGGVLVRTEVAGQLEVDGPFGRIDYREEYTLHLASQTPHR